jgi:hypothetical protein
MTVIGTCGLCGATSTCDGNNPHLSPHDMPGTDVACPQPVQALALVGVAS